MKSIAIAFLSMLTMLTVGCVQSVQPFYKADQVIAMPELEGEWADAEGNSMFKLESNPDGKSYTLYSTDTGKTEKENIVWLAKVGGRTIADCMEIAPENENATQPAEPRHRFLIVELKDHDTLVITAINHKWLGKQLEADPTLLKHEKLGSDEILLTGSTDEIQAFLIKHFDTPEAFGRVKEYKRAGTTTKPAQSNE